MNGQNGARRNVTRWRTSNSVACAARESERGALGSVRQKRRLVRRTYQFETSSISSVSASVAPRLVRVEVHGEPWENIHQRSGSAPRVFRTSHGSMTLPTDLLIFLPFSSTM